MLIVKNKDPDYKELTASYLLSTLGTCLDEGVLSFSNTALSTALALTWRVQLGKVREGFSAGSFGRAGQDGQKCHGVSVQPFLWNLHTAQGKIKTHI